MATKVPNRPDLVCGSSATPWQRSTIPQRESDGMVIPALDPETGEHSTLASSSISSADADGVQKRQPTVKS